MTPRQAKTFKQICQLQTDNKDTKEGWIIIDGGNVSLCNQRRGESATGDVKFSRRAFNALIDWYNRDQRKLRRAPR